jgi:hypothetical protein
MQHWERVSEESWSIGAAGDARAKTGATTIKLRNSFLGCGWTRKNRSRVLYQAPLRGPKYYS